MSKIQYSNTEKLLIQVEKTIKNPSVCESDLNFLYSISSFYLVNKRLTEKQAYTANKIIKKYKIKKKAEKPKKYNLYAITDGENVKLGFSSNVKSRVSGLQTGSAVKLKVLWKYFVGNNRQVAKNAEKKLHRYCREYKIRGEWFRMDCIDMVKKFKL